MNLLPRPGLTILLHAWPKQCTRDPTSVPTGRVPGSPPFGQSRAFGSEMLRKKKEGMWKKGELLAEGGQGREEHP